MQLLAEGLWSGGAISAVSSGLHLLFFIWEEISLHLPWKANICKQSGLKQRNQVQGQINSTAVIGKLSTVVLVLSHSRRSDLIGSSLDLHMDLETPKVWEFTSGVLSIGWKNWREDAYQQLGEGNQGKYELWGEWQVRNIDTPVLFQLHLYIPHGYNLPWDPNPQFCRSTGTWELVATTLPLWLLSLCLNRSLFGAQVVHVATDTTSTVWEITHMKVLCRSAQAQTHTALGPFLLTIRPIEHIKINLFLQLCTAVQPSISRSKQKHPLLWKYKTSFPSRSTNCTQEGVVKHCWSSDLYSVLHTFDSPFCRRRF